MAVFLSPFGGAGWQFFNNDGTVLWGGKIYTYAAGTNTPQATYTTSAGSIAHTNPIILNSAGRVSTGEIWLLSTSAYKFVLNTSADVLIATYDNVWGIGAAGGSEAITPIIYNATGTGSQTTFGLGSTPTNENLTNIYINGVYQQKNTYLLSGANLVFSTAPPVTSLIEVSFT
ncbi:Domain of unknown function DUF4183 [uncultured Caudovirales phage]|uniref:DUF4183 domain-containing protein n=1 Tax=uncultured Caudovirales phage TaxID=2100421 RepID=A0A6J5T8V2_9CAUD|nr:Domain of unknown function DUF4183 [uncultured Caudovirales phage]